MHLSGYNDCCYLLTFFALLINQVKKDSKRPYLLSGCKVLDGQGLMLVSLYYVTTVLERTNNYVFELH